LRLFILDEMVSVLSVINHKVLAQDLLQEEEARAYMPFLLFAHEAGKEYGGLHYCGC
jgi:ABC-type dipeptide/oligopeptide/nickel transport system ATPase subunit